MLELILIAGAGFFLLRRLQTFHVQAQDRAIVTPRVSARVNRLWDKAQSALKDHRLKAAEKSLLNILKIDHKNAGAYNRLGTIYARQKNLEDARECFEIASSLTPTLSSLYNLGLVEYELSNWQAAANAFEKVIDLEPTAPRYVAFAKAQNKLGNPKKVISALEAALGLQKSAKLYETLAQVYEAEEDFDRADEARRKAENLRRRGRKK